MPCSRKQRSNERFIPESRRGNEVADSLLSQRRDLKDTHRFLNCQDGGKTPGRSLLKVGVQASLEDAGFDEEAFIDRGGIFDWTREAEQGENEFDW